MTTVFESWRPTPASRHSSAFSRPIAKSLHQPRASGSRTTPGWIQVRRLLEMLVCALRRHGRKDSICLREARSKRAPARNRRSRAVGYSSLIAALTMAMIDGGILEAWMPWSFSACSAASFRSSSSVSARSSWEQFMPRSLQRSTLPITVSFMFGVPGGHSTIEGRFPADFLSSILG